MFEPVLFVLVLVAGALPPNISPNKSIPPALFVGCGCGWEGCELAISWAGWFSFLALDFLAFLGFPVPIPDESPVTEAPFMRFLYPLSVSYSSTIVSLCSIGGSSPTLLFEPSFSSLSNFGTGTFEVIFNCISPLAIWVKVIYSLALSCTSG